MSSIASDPERIKLHGTALDSIVDGPGLRYVLFAQGCPHGCKGCHNPASHGFDGGTWRTVDELMQAIQRNPLLTGITLSGGEPFGQAAAFANLATQARAIGLSVWAYSGYTFEQLRDASQPEWQALLETLDVLVDGPFVLAERSLTLPFRGSRNQRLIDVPETLSSGQIKMWMPPVW